MKKGNRLKRLRSIRERQYCLKIQTRPKRMLARHENDLRLYLRENTCPSRARSSKMHFPTAIVQLFLNR